MAGPLFSLLENTINQTESPKRGRQIFARRIVEIVLFNPQDLVQPLLGSKIFVSRTLRGELKNDLRNDALIKYLIVWSLSRGHSLHHEEIWSDSLGRVVFDIVDERIRRDINILVVLVVAAKHIKR